MIESVSLYNLLDSPMCIEHRGRTRCNQSPARSGLGSRPPTIVMMMIIKYTIWAGIVYLMCVSNFYLPSFSFSIFESHLPMPTAPLVPCSHMILGSPLQIVTWTVAALLIVINGYLLLDFFSSEVRGPWFTSATVIITSAYAAFIIYLILHGRSMPAKLASALPRRYYNSGS